MSKCLRRKLKDYCIIQGFARMGFGTNEQRGMDGIRKNEREVHEVKCFRNGVNLFRKAILICLILK